MAAAIHGVYAEGLEKGQRAILQEMLENFWGKTAPPSIESLVVRRVTVYCLRGFSPPGPPADPD